MKSRNCNCDFASPPAPNRFINPHRLFHGVWLPQWLEERPDVSEKAKKLYAYLTYFAGGKGYSWPSFGLLGEKLHCSRRHVVRLVQELSAHRLITVTNVSNPERGHCANYYRFLWHPWMQTERDAKFVLETVENEPVDFSEESAPDNCQAGATPGDICVTSPLVTSRSPAPGDIPVTSPGDIHVTPLVTPMSPQENNKKRTNNREKVPVTFSTTVTSKACRNDGFAAPQGSVRYDENHSRTPRCRIADGDRNRIQTQQSRACGTASRRTRRAPNQTRFHPRRSTDES